MQRASCATPANQRLTAASSRGSRSGPVPEDGCCQVHRTNWRQRNQRSKAVAAWKQQQQAPPRPLRRRTTVEFAKHGMNRVPEVIYQTTQHLMQSSRAAARKVGNTPTSISGQHLQSISSGFRAVYLISFLVLVFAMVRAQTASLPLHPIQSVLQPDRWTTLPPLERLTHAACLAILYTSALVLPTILIWPILKQLVADVVAITRWLRGPQTTGPTKPPADPRHYYTMIGECYVHQMMDGEAIAWQNEDRETRAPVMFELR